MPHYKSLRYETALAIAGCMFVLELYTSYKTNSQALFGDAWHVLGDMIPLCFGWYAAHAHADGRETRRLEYGITLMNVVFLVAVAIAVSTGGYLRLLYPDPEPILASWTIFVAAIGAAGNLAQMWIANGLEKEHHEVHTGWGQWLHFFSDFLSSLVVIVGAFFVLFGAPWGDAAASIVVSGVILFLACKLLYTLHFKHQH